MLKVETVADRIARMWRRLTGRERRIIGTDFSGSESYWCEASLDTRTGKITILAFGEWVKGVMKA